jgi:CRISPR-associated exonuclease Cas4
VILLQEDELVHISALQHFSFCARQCGLIHLEQCFEENALTMRGQALHSKVDVPDSCLEGAVRVEYGLSLFSNALGLLGKADVVEFLPDGSPFPVEFKHGKRAEHAHDEIQLAAQAMCLEEMTGRNVSRGAIYHFSSRRRRDVEISEALREQTRSTIISVREMLLSRALPPPVNDSRCRNCSLISVCQPAVIADRGIRNRLMKELFSGEQP